MTTPSTSAHSSPVDPAPERTEDRVTEWIFNYLLDDVVLGFAFDVHRAVSTGLWHVIEGVPEDEEPHRLVDDPNLDVFGQPRGQKRPLECVCPQCNRTLAAFRFAPHLEKCMGMGRSSSRIASQRIAKSSRDNGGDEDANDDDDDEWDFRSEAVKRASIKKKPPVQPKPIPSSSSRKNDMTDDAEDESDDVIDDSNDEDFVLDDKDADDFDYVSRNGEASDGSEFFDCSSNQSLLSVIAGSSESASPSRKLKQKHKKSSNKRPSSTLPSSSSLVSGPLSVPTQNQSKLVGERRSETPCDVRSRSPASPSRVASKFTPSPSPSSRSSWKEEKAASQQNPSAEPALITIKFEPYTAGPSEDIMHFDGLTKDEKKTLLKQICGAIVEYGHKLCTAMKCQIHSEEDRQNARFKLTSFKSMTALQAAELPPGHVLYPKPPSVTSVMSSAFAAAMRPKVKKKKDKDKHKKRSEPRV